MPGSETAAAGPSRLARLLGFLEADPDNLSLIEDAAACAYEEGELDAAGALIERYATAAPLTLRLRNLRGMVAISNQRFDLAAAEFETLLQENPADPGLRFNLAWSRAMLQDFAGAAELIDEQVVAVAPRAAALKIQSLHHQGRMDEALEVGRGYAERFPQNHEMMGALSAAALDSGDLAVAAAYANKARSDPEGLATLGMLELERNHPAEAGRLFDKALGADPHRARALLGKGMVRLAVGDTDAAISLIDEAAELFRTHLGSWVTSGWACLVNGDLVGARRRFEKAMSIDDTFAETHGALAVLDIMQSRMADARRRMDVALRLDRNCFSAALARMLLLQAEGKEATAERVRDAALNTPVGPGGRTLGQAMAGLGRVLGRGESRKTD
jgi:tetratricopeptide (TPR) repeat protein